ncbi:hypothetical protein [Flindersiella endophytica]
MLDRLRRVFLDPVLLIGALISIVTPLVFYQRGAESEFSVLVGLLLFATTLLLQLILTDHERLDRQTLYGRTVAAFESTSWLSADVRRILGFMEGAERRFRDSPIDVVCRNTFARVASDVAQLSEGHIKLPAHEKGFAIEVCGQMRHHLRALTIETVRPHFWLTPVGRQYFDAQREAVARGVRIDRVIVYEDWHPELDAIANEQRSVGIHVYRVKASLLTSDLQVNTGIWDEVCGFETEVNAGGEPVFHRFTIRDYEVAALIRRFDSVWAMREQIPEPGSETPPAAG